MISLRAWLRARLFVACIGQTAFKGIWQVCCSLAEWFGLEFQQFFNAFLQNSSVPNNRLIGIANANKICAIYATKGQPKIFSNPLEKTNPRWSMALSRCRYLSSMRSFCVSMLWQILLSSFVPLLVSLYVLVQTKGLTMLQHVAVDQGAQGNNTCCFEVLCSHGAQSFTHKLMALA